MFGIYLLALFVLLVGLGIGLYFYEIGKLNKLSLIGSLAFIMIAYILCFFGDRLYLIYNLIAFSVVIVLTVSTTFIIKDTKIRNIICYLLSFCIIIFGQSVQIRPYPTPLSRGNIERYILSGNGTLDDPYMIQRGNIYTDQFDQIVINTIENGKVIETYEQQIHGGYWINTSLSEDQEVNFVDIHYIKSFYPEYWYDIKENDVNPFPFTTYLGENISIQDRYTIYKIQKKSDNYELQIINYIIHYEDSYYASSLIKEWHKENSTVNIYDNYGNGHYLMGGS